MGGSKSKVEDDKNGPIGDGHRECRDILCCLLFIVNVVALIYLTINGITNGDVARLSAVYDMAGQACGIDAEVADYPYIYFATPHVDYLKRTTCVKSCPEFTVKCDSDGENCSSIFMAILSPTDNAVYTDSDGEEQAGKPPFECMPNDYYGEDGEYYQNVDSCVDQCDVYPIDFSEINWLTFSLDDYIPPWETLVCVYPTTTVLDRICIPSGDFTALLGTDFEETLATYGANGDMSTILADVQIGWPVIAGAVGISLLVGLIYMGFLYCFAGIIVWICIACFFAIMAYVSYLFYASYLNIVQYQTDCSCEPTEGDYTTDNMNLNMYIAYACFAILALSFVGFLCMFRNIRLAIAIVKCAADCIKDNLMMMGVPPFIGILVLILWGLWIFGIMYIYSCGTIEKSPSGPYAGVTHSEEQQYIMWYFLFGGLWCNAFLQALTQFTLASTCVMWYFTQGDTGQEAYRLPVITSFYRAFRYHLGSLAFGAFLLALIQFIRIVLEYIKRQMKASGADQNKLTACIMKCLTCVMYCFERFIQFLTRNAYIQIAIKGRNFCMAAKDAMALLWANAARATLIAGMGAAFMMIGKLFITAGVIVACYYIYELDTTYSAMTSYIYCLIVIFFIASCIATLFMSVYGMAIDTILQCFLYDEEIAKGRGNAAPEYVPPQLRAFFEGTLNEKVDAIKAKQ